MNDERVSPWFALGVGLTNACDLACTHCYRAPGTDALAIDHVLAAVDALPTRAVNFGTGENGLHPQFATLVEILHARGIAVTMTTNGRSAAVLSDDVLRKMRDVEFSIDYPTPEAHDEARARGNWDLIESQMARCRRLGVSTAIVTVLMSHNHRAMRDLVALARARGSLLRVNVYQPARHDLASPSFDEFWRAWSDLLDVADIVACGEPVVRAVLGLPAMEGEGCGKGTVRLTPRREVVGCVYEKETPISLADLVRIGPRIVDTDEFQRRVPTPTICEPCAQKESCRGGCASRRRLAGSVGSPDTYCPIVRGIDVALRRPLAAAEGPIPPKAASACTTILRPRPFDPS